MIYIRNYGDAIISACEKGEHWEGGLALLPNMTMTFASNGIFVWIALLEMDSPGARRRRRRRL